VTPAGSKRAGRGKCSGRWFARSDLNQLSARRPLLLTSQSILYSPRQLSLPLDLNDRVLIGHTNVRVTRNPAGLDARAADLLRPRDVRTPEGVSGAQLSAFSYLGPESTTRLPLTSESTMVRSLCPFNGVNIPPHGRRSAASSITRSRFPGRTTPTGNRAHLDGAPAIRVSHLQN
jgi:hypothetical protein